MALTLTRKTGEEIRVGADVRITVGEMRGGKVRLHFTAPPHVAIHREEVARKNEQGETIWGPVEIPKGGSDE